MDQLLSLAGFFVIAALRILYTRICRTRDSLLATKPPIPQEDEESQPLIAPPRAAQVSLTLRRKVVCSLAAVAYIVVTVFVTIATIKELEGPVLRDSRFVLGRGGMITIALIVLARTWFYKSPDLLVELQVDAVTLVAIPYVMDLVGTPVAQFPERRIANLVLSALGLICFLSAKGSFYSR